MTNNRKIVFAFAFGSTISISFLELEMRAYLLFFCENLKILITERVNWIGRKTNKKQSKVLRCLC